MIMKCSSRSPTITVFRLRSDRMMYGDNIPMLFIREWNGKRSIVTHATTVWNCATTASQQGTIAAYGNKSDYIYLTQSTDSNCESRQMLVIRFPLDDLGATQALVSHITELMRTTNTVTMKCDFNAYLNNVSISRNLALDESTNLSRHPVRAISAFQSVEAPSCRQGGSYTKFDDLLALVANEKALLKRAIQESRGRPLPRLRLCGGGEDSINNGTSAWGTPPSATNGTSAWGLANQQPPQAWAGTTGNNSANNNQQTTSQSQRQPSQLQDQNANKAPQQNPNGNNGSTPNAWNRNSTQPTGPNPNIANNNGQPSQQQQQQLQQQQQQQLVLANNGPIAAKSQLEQLSNMREALFSQDGWGYQHVNQDTNWEVPGSPEPGKVDTNNAASGGAPNPAASGWKPCNSNNGTELWEANLRNGGAPQPPQTVQKAPWGPATNIGGTWGEDDDSGEASVWNGASGANQPTAAPQAWGQNSPAVWPPGAPAGPNPVTVKKENEWSGVIGANTGTAAPVLPAVTGWDNRGGSAPPVNITGSVGQTTPLEAAREIRGDPRGISGRLNGNGGMWDQPNVQNLPAAAKIIQGTLPSAAGGINNQWNTPAPNKLPGTWDDSPSSINTRPTLDDGSSALWNQGPLSRQNSNVASWKDMSDSVVRNPIPRAPLGGAANLPLGPVTRGVRLGGMNPGMKPDTSMWGQNQGLPLNSSWDECNSSGWEDKGLGNNGPWNDFGQNALWNKNKQGGWPDPSDMITGGAAGSGSDWTMNKPPSKMSPAEFIRSSKQYRMLCENGFKKDDVEFALRSTNMNFDESLDILQRHSALGGLGDWRRPEDHPGSAFEAPYSNRFPAGPGAGMPFSQNQNLLNNIPGVGGTNPNLAALNNLKYLSQGPSVPHSSFSQGPNPMAAAGAGTGNPQNSQAQPSTQQLRMLVQQIQMAVQTGFLNHQILNQPLAPQTLLLLNQLLNHIRQMQHIQSNLARSGGATGVSTVQLTMQINKHKVQISQLQQQIAAQQAIYVKQQQQQQQHQPGGSHQPPGTPGALTPGPGAADFLRQQELVSLQNNFTDMALGKDPGASTGNFPSNVATSAAVNNNAPANSGIVAGNAGVTSQQSRLNQWKLPTLDKDGRGAGGTDDLTDFSRAPGTTAKSTLSTTSPNIGSLGLQDGTWSSGRSNLVDGWPDQSSGVGESDNKDWAPAQDNSAFSDLVPEFEPGKPWKGAQMKIDEDPSITPGSVARSPLSIATAKDADLFGTGSKASPTDPMSLAPSTWSFNPTHPTAGGAGKLVAGAGKNAWPDSISSTATSTSSDLWGTPMGKPTRGPPPGLGASKNSVAAANGWTGGGGGQRSGSMNNWPSGNGWGSSWLLLKNLTPQIDGATLRTLCMQHGPLQSLQLYLNHGLALCKYSTREEANKAQQTLNNCPLGNSTIGAECPSDTEVQTYLQQLGAPTGNVAIGGGVNSSGSIVPPSSSGSVTSVAQSWRQAPRSAGADAWGSGWPPSSAGSGSSSLWAPLEGATERGTPSNLNSFLPESLLGTELN
ncbi:protein Gawky-like [Topomyia yanbarensis]|uniref:protein Gawky-like n=1 Tax=Topomyia yanbarensis TaxID=2498891 RepID=UPI00273C5D40|nr:protein Gawky-like [Topomyia yanbarensis]